MAGRAPPIVPPAAGTWDVIEPRLSPSTFRCLELLGFDQMTPVQASTIPLFLQHKDVLVQACTGSGKTLAFVIPIFELILRRDAPLRKGQVGGIVITPTRELATQIEQVARLFLDTVPPELGLTMLLLVGGSATEDDIERFRTAGGSLLVATPGRLLDILERGAHEFNFKELEVLVLDEADRLLDMGFETAINNILKHLPKQRRTGLFSATQTKEVKALARAGLRNPVQVMVEVEDKSRQSTQQTPSTLDNRFLVTRPERKLSQLVAFLQAHRKEKSMVYFLTCACVDYFGLVLSRLKALKNFPIVTLHGQMKPNKRISAYKEFVDAPNGALVCTDIAARGLDIVDVAWVVQCDPPQDPAAFVHRCGRTARLGREGAALVFLMPQEESYADFLRLRNIPIEPAALPTDNEVTDITAEVRQLAIADRDVFDKGMRAYVSYMRAYKEHLCTFIFKLSELDLGGVATGFGLIQLPRMPELSGKEVSFEAADVDTNSIAYKDKAREKQRQIKLEKFRASADERKKAAQEKKKSREKTEAWSKVKDRKEKKEERREKNKKRKAAEAFGRHDDVDWAELEKEARLLKKLKRGHITEDEFRREMEGDLASEEPAEDDEKEAGAAEDVDADVEDASGGESGAEDAAPVVYEEEWAASDAEEEFDVAAHARLHGAPAAAPARPQDAAAESSAAVEAEEASEGEDAVEAEAESGQAAGVAVGTAAGQANGKKKKKKKRKGAAPPASKGKGIILNPEQKVGSKRRL